jgi:ATP-dependent RNA helicase RhlE
MRFEAYKIAREIKQALKEIGYTKPTDIQYKAIPSILKREDVLAIAQTGTGKTAAFAIPIIHLLNNMHQSRRPDGIKCVVLAPTHELVLQIADVFRQIGKYTPVQTMSIIGGVDQDPQIAILEGGIDIIVATPGRLFDLKSQGYIHLDRVEILVLDEADHMLDLGFIKDIQDLGRSLPRNRQTLFFSATIDEKIKDIAYSLVRNPIRIQISPKNPVAKNIQHSVAYIEMDDKRFFLERMIKENPESKFIAFVRTIVRAERVSAAMARAGIESQTIHREKRESERENVMEGFRSGDFKLLVATDISARGIDIPDIDFVVNYDLPQDVEMYVHRVGRTGRGKQKGIAVSFVSEEEKPLLADIEAYLEQPIQTVDIYTKDYRVTREMAAENKNDWKKLMKDAQEEDKTSKKKKGKRGKK